MNRKVAVLIAPLAMIVFAVLSAAPAVAGDWIWSVAPYFWATNLNLDVSIDDRQVVDERVDVTDLIDKLDVVLAVHVEGQKSKWGAFADVYFADFNDDEKTVDLAGSIPGNLVVKGDMEFTILEIGGLYNPRMEGKGFSLLYGARAFDVDEKIEARYAFPGGVTSADRTYRVSSTLWDGFLGGRYVGDIGERWLYRLRADVGAGDTDFTWNALAGFGYTFGKERQNSVELGYRAMGIDFEQRADVPANIKSEMVMSGIYGAVKFSF